MLHSNEDLHDFSGGDTMPLLPALSKTVQTPEGPISRPRQHQSLNHSMERLTGPQHHHHHQPQQHHHHQQHQQHPQQPRRNLLKP